MDVSNAVTQLLQHNDYRAFLKEALSVLGSRSGRINYAAFSRKAGFTSRSFPRDVIVGKRRMTLTALPKFVRGLNLRGDLRIYFQTLVYLQETDLNQSGQTPAQLKEKLLKIRAGADSKTNVKSSTGPLFIQYRRWQEIFAALGTIEHGATISEIELRTEFSKANCLDLLKEMINAEIVKYDASTDRYYALKWHLKLPDLGANKYFEQHLRHRLNQAHNALETKINSPDFLFFNSVWSVQKSRLPEFKNELRNLLQQFVETTEESNGDSLNHILVCMGKF